MSRGCFGRSPDPRYVGHQFDLDDDIVRYAASHASSLRSRSAYGSAVAKSRREARACALAAAWASPPPRDFARRAIRPGSATSPDGLRKVKRNPQVER